MNKIGFRYSAAVETPSNEVATIEEKSVAISPAQADLIETINNLADLIAGVEFANFKAVQRAAFVNQLINSVALNAELTAKTSLLIG